MMLFQVERKNGSEWVAVGSAATWPVAQHTLWLMRTKNRNRTYRIVPVSEAAAAPRPENGRAKKGGAK